MTMVNLFRCRSLGQAALLLLLLAGVDGILPREADAQGQCNSSATQHSQPPSGGPQAASPNGIIQALLALVNQERQQVGLSALVLDEQLNQAAQRQAEDLARRGSLSHRGTEGSTMQTRIEDAGYSWSAIGENIAMGQTSPQTVMDSWMGSSGHRQNILNPAFSELGVGYVDGGDRKYWVQLFATPH